MADKGKGPWWRQTKVWQYVGAVGALAVSGTLAAFSAWPFDTQPLDPGKRPSVWEVLVNDRWTQGSLRLGLVAVVAYVVASVPALIIGRRWMKGLGTSGLAADEARNMDQIIEEYEETVVQMEAENQEILMVADTMMNDLLAELRAVEEERDELLGLLDGGGAQG